MPTNWLSAVLFTILIAPGLVFDLLSTHRLVRAKESAFREISRITLSAVIFSSAGLAAAAWASHEWVGTFLELDSAVRDGWDYIKNNQALALRSLALAMGVAVVLAFITDRVLRLRSPKLLQKSAWTLVFKRKWPWERTEWLRENIAERVRRWWKAPGIWIKGPGTDSNATIVLSDGALIRGIILNFSPDHELEDRELVLKKPIYIRAAGQTEWKKTLSDRMILKYDDVVRIGVRYSLQEPEGKATRAASSSNDNRAPEPRDPEMQRRLSFKTVIATGAVLCLVAARHKSRR